MHRLPHLSGALRATIWVSATGFFSLVAAIAAVILIQDAVHAWQSAGAVATLGAVLLLGGLLAIGGVERGPLHTHPLAVGLILLVASRLAVVAWLPTVQVSDFLYYHELAKSILSSGFAWTPVPVGWPALLAASYAVFGADPVVGETLNILLAAATGWFIYATGLIVFGRRSATLGLWLFAAAPAQVLYVAVLGTETLYGALLSAAVWLIARFGWQRLAGAAGAGALLAVAQYVRAETPAIAAGLVAASAAAYGMRGLRQGLILLAVFLVMLTPVVVHNLETEGEPSIATSNFLGWSLLVGTNPQNGGSYNADLIARVGGTPGTVDFDRRALALALHQMASNPLGVAKLAVLKIPTMWATEDYANTFVVNETSPPGRFSSSNFQSLSLLVSQGAYVVVLFLAAGSIWLRRLRDPVSILVIGIFLAMAAIHALAEVQPRYHAFLVPLASLLAGGVLNRSTDRGATESAVD